MNRPAVRRSTTRRAGLWQRLVQGFLLWRAASHRHLGNLFGDRDSHLKAVADLTSALARDPANLEALIMRGTLFWRELNEPVRAIIDLQHALEIVPSRSEARFNRAMAFHAAGDTRSAILDLETYLQQEPNGVWATNAQRLLFQLRSFDEKDEKTR